MMMNNHCRLYIPPQQPSSRDVFHRFAISDHNSDMYKQCSLSLDKSEASYRKKGGRTTFSREKVMQHHKTPVLQTTPFRLILPKESYFRLEPGMVLLKNYLTLNDQVEIVDICQYFHKGFYRVCHTNGVPLPLYMMCFGRNWDPQTKYNEHYRSDGYEAPPIPDKFISLVEAALGYTRARKDSKDEIPPMHPDICVVNFRLPPLDIIFNEGGLGLHQDKDESSFSLKRGLPVVSICIGDSAEFVYGYSNDVNKLNTVLLESGDVLIFGGKSRHIFHGVKNVIDQSAPRSFLERVRLKPGLLNLTFRQF